MAGSGHDETRMTARLPNLDLVVVHRRPRDGDGEQMMIAFRAVPPAEAFGRLLEAANPLLFWMGLIQAVWSPWLGGPAIASAAIREGGGK
jgi:hypothetical protein